MQGYPRHENATLGSRCSCLGSGKGGRGCRDTPDTKTRHWGRVFLSGVLAASLTVGRVVGRVQGHPRHENATLGSRFLVWGVGSVPDTKNATLWSRSSCLGSGNGGRGWWEGRRDTPDTKTRHWSRVFLSGVLATYLTRRTRRVLRVWAVGRVQGHPRQENATPVSRFLVWGVRNVRVVEDDARTPERDHKVAFWCSRRGRGRGSA